MLALALDAFELLLDALDALADHAPVELDLRLARAAARADAAALALEVAPAPHQARRQVLQARELDLELAFVAPGALAEDLEDQHRAVGDGDAEVALEVALLRRRERLVEDAPPRPVQLDQLLHLVGLAAADEEGRDRAPCGARRRARRRRRRRTRRASASSSSDASNSRPRTEVDADEDRPRRRFAVRAAGSRSTAAAQRGANDAPQDCSARVGLAAWKFTARPGTTVEMACL